MRRNFRMPVLPSVAQAMQRDPRYMAGQQAMQQGSSTAPAVGAYDGIARVLQGLMGGFMTRDAGNRFAKQEEGTNINYRDAVARALGGGDMGADKPPVQPVPNAPTLAPTQPPPAMAQPPMQPDGMVPGQQPPPSMAPPMQSKTFQPRPTSELPRETGGGFQGPQSGPTAPLGDIANVLTGMGEGGRYTPGIVPEAGSGFGVSPIGGPGATTGQPDVQEALRNETANIARPTRALRGRPPASELVARSGERSQATSSRVNPFASWAITSRPGDSRDGGRRRHQGYDFAPRSDDHSIRGHLPWEVVRYTPQRGRRDISGNRVTVEYSDGTRAQFMHLAGPPAANSGGVGDVIAVAGRSGNATGTTTHVQLTRGGRHVNAERYFRGQPLPDNARQAASNDGVANNGDRFASVQPVNPTTPEPNMPERPEAPDAVKAVRSQRLSLARELIESGDPYLMEQAQAMLNEGMGEQTVSDREAAGRQFDLNRLGYGEGLQDYNDARQQGRTATYEARRMERDAGYRQQEQARQFRHDDVTREDGQDFTQGESALDRANTRHEGRAGRDSNERVAKWQIQGRGDVAERRAENTRRYLDTPQGRRYASEQQEREAMRSEIETGLSEFERLNQEEPHTGYDLIPGSPISAIRRRTSARMREMDSINARLAPLMRQVGSGSMSDRDVELFRSAVPSPDNPQRMNQSIITRMRRAMERVRDQENSFIEAMQEDRLVDFNREWARYRQQSSVFHGNRYYSFQEWRDSRPQVDRNGRPVRQQR